MICNSGESSEEVNYCTKTEKDQVFWTKETRSKSKEKQQEKQQEDN